MGLERIIEFIFEFIADILPFYVVDVYEKSVVLRFGKVHRIREQGFWWKIPFADKPINYTVVTTTIETPVQSLVTKDDKEVSIKSVVKYNISDVEIHTTSIYDATDAICDLTQGHIMNECNNLTYDECRDTLSLSNIITKKVRNEVKKYGIYIEQITLTNFIKTTNVRLFNETDG